MKSFKEHTEELIKALDGEHTHWSSELAIKNRMRSLIIVGEYFISEEVCGKKCFCASCRDFNGTTIEIQNSIKKMKEVLE